MSKVSFNFKIIHRELIVTSLALCAIQMNMHCFSIFVSRWSALHECFTVAFVLFFFLFPLRLATLQFVLHTVPTDFPPLVALPFRFDCKKFLQLHLVLHLRFVIAIIIDSNIILYLRCSRRSLSRSLFWISICICLCLPPGFYVNFSCKLLLMHFECNLCFVCWNRSGAHKNS